MRWKVSTPNKDYIVSATSSKEAVDKVLKNYSGPVIKSVIMPKNAVDTLKSKWRSWFGK